MVTAAITATGVILSLSATIAWMSYNAGLNDCQAYDGIVIGYGQTAFISTITYLFSTFIDLKIISNALVPLFTAIEYLVRMIEENFFSNFCTFSDIVKLPFFIISVSPFLILLILFFE